MNDSVQPPAESKASIIKSVTTPLGFFALVMLVVEGLFLVIAGRAAQSDLILVLVISAIVIGVFAAIVSYVVFKEPSILLGTENVARLAEAKSQFDTLQEKAEQLKLNLEKSEAQNQELRADIEAVQAKLSRYESLKSQVWALLNQGGSVDVIFLLRGLRLEDNHTSRNDILGVLGTLVEEGKIEGDGMKAQGSYRVRTRN